MEKVGSILKNILNKGSLTKGGNYVSFFKEWDKIAEDPLSSHSEIEDIKRNNLIISVDHPGWLQILRFNEKRILNRINKTYPEFKIKYIKAFVKIKKDNSEEIEEKEEINNNLDDFDIKAIDNIKDITLKNSLIRLYNNIMEKSDTNT